MKLSVLASSSSGNSIYIEHNNFRCLVDAGLTGKKVVENLAQIERDIKDINAIFVTHEHIDHIKGVGVLARKYNIPVYANALTWQNMTKCGEISSDLKFNFEKEESKIFGDVVVNSFGVSHDAINPQFYTFECEGKRVSILTDTGYVSDKMIDYLANNAYDPHYGARPLRRYIQKEIETSLAKKILANEVHEKSDVLIDLDNNHIVFKEK